MEMIRQQKIRAGEKFPSERELSEMFHVSRPSLREAFRVLETIGLVEIRAGGGVYLTELNLGPFLNTFAPLITTREGFELELLVLREALEVKAAELCASICDAECAAYIREPIEEMRKALESNDPAAGAAGDILFHTRIIERSGNFMLQKAAEFVNFLLEFSIKDGRRIVLKEEEDAASLYEDHRKICDAIIDNDPSAARDLMADHIEMVRRLYKKAIS